MTRADFYVGRGLLAEWLGSMAMDGYPDGHPKPLLQIQSADAFRKGVTDVLASVRHATTPDQGWPWPWGDSRTTDFAYAFDGDRVWICRYGCGWLDWPELVRRQRMHDEWDLRTELPDPSDPEPEVWPHEEVEFPDMTSLQSVSFGARSGLIILGS